MLECGDERIQRLSWLAAPCVFLPDFLKTVIQPGARSAGGMFARDKIEFSFLNYNLMASRIHRPTLIQDCNFRKGGLQRRTMSLQS
jgi:hypothetical protein